MRPVRVHVRADRSEAADWGVVLLSAQRQAAMIETRRSGI